MDWLRSWFGYSRVRFTHHPDPVVLALRSPPTIASDSIPASKSTSTSKSQSKSQVESRSKASSPSYESSQGQHQTTLLDLVKSSTPPCWLNPLLFNGHLQTIWTALREATDIPIYYKRWIFEAAQPEYAGQFAVDFMVPPYDTSNPDPNLPQRTTYYTKAEFEALGNVDPRRINSVSLDGSDLALGEEMDPEATGAEALTDDDDRPMLICLHGLTGGSYEHYLRAVLEPLVEAGWAACVINSRGCAKSKITSGFMYNARSTWDCRQIVQWCKERWPRRKLYGIGFSLGANMLVNYVAEEGENCVLEAAVVCSNPWNLEVAALGLQRTFLGYEVYSKSMGSNLRNLVKQHLDVLGKNPRVDVEAALKIKYIHEYDRVLQCPIWGYPTENAYYRDASSSDALISVRIPLLAINAEDDPEFKCNPYCVLLTSSMGGHLSWFQFNGTRWFAKPAANFLMKMAAEVKSAAKTGPAQSSAKPGVPIAYSPSFFASSRHKLRMPGIN